MKIATTRIEVSTEDGVSLADITGEVNGFVAGSGIEDGLCILTIAVPSVALSLVADAEETMEDLLRLGHRFLRASTGPVALVKAEGVETGDPSRSDLDEPGYAPAGVLADCMSIALRAGALELGNWEGLLLIDGAGPRHNAVEVTLIGD